VQQLLFESIYNRMWSSSNSHYSYKLLNYTLFNMKFQTLLEKIEIIFIYQNVCIDLLILYQHFWYYVWWFFLCVKSFQNVVKCDSKRAWNKIYISYSHIKHNESQHKIAVFKESLLPVRVIWSNYKSKLYFCVNY